MDRKEAKELLKEASEEYQEHPRNWSFWISTDPKSPELYLIHGEKAYFLKVDSIYTPKPVGVGAKLRVDKDQLPKNLPEYGFRRLKKREVEKVFENVSPPSEADTKEEIEKKFLEVQKQLGEKAADKKPVPFGPPQEPGEVGAIGPFVPSDPLEYVSDEQRELKENLARELEKLRRRRYPGYA